MGQARIIFHVDMNSFYASVEQAHHPDLRGKPLAIAGRVEERRGIIVTSSYEARAKGVKTTMRVREARRLCPDLIVKTPDFPLYRETSRQMFEILRSFTPLVQKVSIDEGYLDVTETVSTHHPIELARTIQQTLLEDLQLPSSVGIAPNKFLAKMASNMKKPMGLTILRKRDVPSVLWPLNIGAMHGVGPKTAEKFERVGIHTIGDLAKAEEGRVKRLLGQHGEKLYLRANGQDLRPVDPKQESVYKSMSQSTTFPVDLTQLSEARPVFKKFSETLSKKLKMVHYTAYQIQVQIRYSNWTQVTRMKTLDQPTDEANQIERVAMSLFEEHWSGKPVRLLGLGVQKFETKKQVSKQLDLFTFQEEAKKEPLYEVMESIQTRFGKELLTFGSETSKKDKN